MPRRLRFHACLAALLAMLFVVFFQMSKHQPGFAALNPFADDPYDAIGSFATQFAVAAALLGLVRAFRPYGATPATNAQQRLLSRTMALSALAVVVTMAGDGVALARHRTLWDRAPAGLLLAGCVVALAVLALAVVWAARPAMNTADSPATTGSRASAWLAAIICFGAVALLAVYPENWTRHMGTELLTVAAGIVLLFVPLWALDRARYSLTPAEGEDMLDDLATLFGGQRSRQRPLAWLAALVATLARMRPIRLVWGWLNPRWHPVVPAAVLGLMMGALLFLAEMRGEGGPAAGRFFVIAAIFLGAECFGVLVGYALLARPLGLFRREPAPTARRANPVEVR